MKTISNKFRNRNGEITRYSFCCGYVMQYELNDDNRITMSLEPNGFHLKGFINGEHFWDILENPIGTVYPIAKARGNFYKIVKEMKSN
jgi:hypothetical protein